MQERTAAADEMWSNDRASASLGIEIIHASAGESTARMTVTPSHCNGLDVCHGGLLFTLADTAMAFASNAEGGRAFATNAEIDFVEAAREGDVLTATCRRIVDRGRAGVHDVEIVNQNGATIAVFRGRTLATRSGGR